LSERESQLEAALIDRERRLFNLASIIRAMTRGGATIPSDCKVDYSITVDEARVLGISNWQKAIEPRNTSG
jgi:hypothetical protein